MKSPWYDFAGEETIRPEDPALPNLTNRGVGEDKQGRIRAPPWPYEPGHPADAHRSNAKTQFQPGPVLYKAMGKPAKGRGLFKEALR